MNYSEQQLINWSKPVSTTEDNMCQNAISQITKVLREKFGNKITIFLQGSYRNNTNVRKNSDVDIVMRYDYVFYPDLYNLTEEDRRIYHSRTPDATYTFENLKADTESTLRAAFGTSVHRENKCIQVDGNSYRVTADVIPCFVLKRYANLDDIEAEGIKFFSDSGNEIKSFPNQHYSNGTRKTERTSRLYKRMVRILKVINNNLIEEGKISEKLVSSFFIECLVYNVADSEFISGNYTQTLRNVIGRIYEDMTNNANYEEVSGLHWLFYSSSLRTRQDAKAFMQACWSFIGY